MSITKSCSLAIAIRSTFKMQHCTSLDPLYGNGPLVVLKNVCGLSSVLFPPFIRNNTQLFGNLLPMSRAVLVTMEML